MSKDFFMAYMDERAKRDLGGSIKPFNDQEKIRMTFRIDLIDKSARKGNKYASCLWI